MHQCLELDALRDFEDGRLDDMFLHAVEAVLDGRTLSGRGAGHSKKEAKKNAAEQLLGRIEARTYCAPLHAHD